MKEEIVNLLTKENKISEKTIDELKQVDINDFKSIVEEIGKQETEYIKADKIAENLNTKYIGKNLYVFHEVQSTNNIAKFLSANGMADGSFIISEKQTAARASSCSSPLPTW